MSNFRVSCSTYKLLYNNISILRNVLNYLPTRHILLFFFQINWYIKIKHGYLSRNRKVFPLTNYQKTNKKNDSPNHPTRKVCVLDSINNFANFQFPYQIDKKK